jgi:ESCRT-I complex subunit TSG101
MFISLNAAIENGLTALLVHFQGTIPVTFRGNTYRFPIALWIPHSYPHDAPIVYVTPTDGMMIRPGQHVGGDGRIYHPYLARWRDTWEVS